MMTAMTSSPTRERILDAAERLFFVDGIGVTGVDRVAAEAGVAIATLYTHVGSKDGLLAAVLERRLTEWTAQWEASIAAAGSPRARLLALFDALIAYRAAQHTQWCCFLATASERPRAESSADPVMRLVDADAQVLVGRLRQLADEAGLADPEATVAQLVLLYNGALASLLREQPADPLLVARTVAHTLVPEREGEG
jgi:AcrR family transcriptional regulator